MLISFKHKFTFLSMTKGVSTSIEDALMDEYHSMFKGLPPAIKNINANVYYNKIQSMHKKLNAPDREGKYKMREELVNQNHPWHLNYTGNIEFEGFVESYIK